MLELSESFGRDLKTAIKALINLKRESENKVKDERYNLKESQIAVDQFWREIVQLKNEARQKDNDLETLKKELEELKGRTEKIKFENDTLRKALVRNAQEAATTGSDPDKLKQLLHQLKPTSNRELTEDEQH